MSGMKKRVRTGARSSREFLESLEELPELMRDEGWYAEVPKKSVSGWLVVVLLVAITYFVMWVIWLVSGGATALVMHLVA